MLCIRSPRRWAIVRCMLAMLVFTTPGLSGVAEAGLRAQPPSPAQASSRFSEMTATSEPIVSSLPFERSASGELLPEPNALKALLAESAAHPDRLLAIRPTGVLSGFDRDIAAERDTIASAGPSGASGERSMLDEGSTALLRVLEMLRKNSPGSHLSVLGLPIERSRISDEAASGSGPYGALLQQLDAFVSTRGLLQPRDAVDERAWMKAALPSAVRFAQGRPILYRTAAGWQQRSMPIESLDRMDSGSAEDSLESDRAAAKELSNPPFENWETPPGESSAPATGTGEAEFATPAAEADRSLFEAPTSSRSPDRFEPFRDMSGTEEPSADPVAEPHLSDFGSGLLDAGAMAESGAISDDEPTTDLESVPPSGGAAVGPAPRALAIVPRALRAFAPLAVGGDLLDPREFATKARSTTSSAGPAPEATSSSASSSNASSAQSSAARTPSRSSPSRASIRTDGRGESAAASPGPTPARASGSSTSSPVATAPRLPVSITPSRPAAPTTASPASPAGSSTAGPASPAVVAPPPLDPVIPITPSTSSGSSPSAPPQPPPPSAPLPPRDWSTLPANVGNEHSRIGSHAPSVNCFGGDVAFANLIYASVKDPASLVRGLNGQGKTFFGTERFLDWTGPAYYSRDGWPFRSDSGPLSRSNAVHIALVWAGTERMWSVLGLRGGFDSPPVATISEDGRSASYPAPRGIAGRSFSFTVTCYWEGQGVAAVGRGRLPDTPQVQAVEFTGPDGQGPFGDGPRTMRSSTAQFTASGDSPGGLIAYIIESDPTGSDPLRNLIVLISDVRDTATGELVYAGFDHRTYRPFQLYPDWVESMRHCSHLRSLHNDLARKTPTAELLIHEDTGLEYEWHMGSHGSTHLLSTGWSRSGPSAPGFDRGFAAINRPTHVGFGNSLRALIEMCNQLGADLWWCHPAPTVFVGTRSSNGTPTYARTRGETVGNPDQVGSILIDEAYTRGFTDEISAHLKPGLKVYSEWVNEIWNTSPSYVWATRYAWTCAMRAVAPVEYGGDGGLWFAKRTLTAPAIHAGVDLKADANIAMAAFSAAASSKLAEAIRDRLGPDSDREIVCVAAGQSVWLARSSNGLGQFWAAMPKLFKQLDAVAHAPYRSWWTNGSEFDAQLADDGFASVWQEIESVRGGLLPYANLPSLSLRDDSYWGTRSRSKQGGYWGYPFQRAWKDLALDRPDTRGVNGSLSYQRAFTPPNWPADRRRWNLDLICYEGGNHHLPVSADAKLQTYPATMHPSYKMFTLRYMEMIFGHGPKGLTRDPASASEEFLYRPGMVPMGIIENAEPLHDRFTFLVTTTQPSFRYGMFWGLQWWNGQLDSPQAEGAKEAVRLGVGTDRWWE